MTDLPHELALGITGPVGDAIYQRVRKGKGNIRTNGRYDLQRRSPGTWTDRRSPAQLAGRRRMAAATAAYQALSIEERNEWRAKAKHRHQTGYNLFVRWFCATWVEPATTFAHHMDGGGPHAYSARDTTLDAGYSTSGNATVADAGGPSTLDLGLEPTLDGGTTAFQPHPDELTDCDGPITEHTTTISGGMA